MPPLHYLHDAPNYPSVLVSELLATSPDFASFTHMDVYMEGKWMTSSISTIVTAPVTRLDTSILIKLRSSMFKGLPDYCCPGLDEELALQVQSSEGSKRKREPSLWRSPTKRSRLVLDKHTSSIQGRVTSATQPGLDDLATHSHCPPPIAISTPVMASTSSLSPSTPSPSTSTPRTRKNADPLLRLSLSNFISRYREYQRLQLATVNGPGLKTEEAFTSAFGDAPGVQNLVKSSFWRAEKPVKCGETLVFHGHIINDIFLAIGDEKGTREQLAFILGDCWKPVEGKKHAMEPFLTTNGSSRLTAFLTSIGQLDLLAEQAHEPSSPSPPFFTPSLSQTPEFSSALLLSSESFSPTLSSPSCDAPLGIQTQTQTCSYCLSSIPMHFSPGLLAIYLQVQSGEKDRSDFCNCHQEQSTICASAHRYGWPFYQDFSVLFRRILSLRAMIRKTLYTPTESPFFCNSPLSDSEIGLRPYCVTG